MVQAEGKDIWLNLTSFVNPSPWLLQWVDSVWLQNSSDIGFSSTIHGSDMEKMLTYRDQAYYDFSKVRQWQLPYESIYNHDPVYGAKAHISFTPDELRTFLYMLGTRGTAFWEFYYSYTMFDEDLESNKNISSSVLKNKSKAISINRVEANSKTDYSIEGRKAFSVYFQMETTSTNTTVLKQGDQYSIGIDPEGKLKFTVGDLSVTSSNSVNNGQTQNIAVVRENNGMLKIYIDGEIVKSGYDKDKAGKNILPAPITIGATDFEGKLSDVVILNRGLKYQELYNLYDKTLVADLALDKPVIGKWSESGENVTVNPYKTLNMITDGNDRIDSYGDFGEDSRRESAYIQVDLGDVYSISGLKLIRYSFARGGMRRETGH